MKKNNVLKMPVLVETLPTPESISTLAVMKWLEKVEPKKVLITPETPEMLKWLETIEIGRKDGVSRTY